MPRSPTANSVLRGKRPFETVPRNGSAYLDPVLYTFEKSFYNAIFDCNIKINEVHVSLFCKNNIRGFDVTMNDTLSVEECEYGA